MFDEPAPRIVEDRASDFFAAVRELLGDRLAECRHDQDRRLRVTVIDLDERDTREIMDAAAAVGIAAWVRTERADPHHLAQWERLRHDLIALHDVQPGPLRFSSTPAPGYRRPPVRIGVAAFAEDDRGA